MDAGSAGGPSEETRCCAIAARLGDRIECPPGGCVLLRALGEELPIPHGAVCPVEQLARGDNPVVLQTLDSLRREMEEDAGRPAWTRRAEARRAARHAATLRRWPAD